MVKYKEGSKHIWKQRKSIIEANRIIKYISKDPTCLKEMCNKYFEKVLEKIGKIQ